MSAEKHAPSHCERIRQAESRWHMDTMLAQAGTNTDPATGAITTPIHLSTAFGHPGLGQSTGYDYSRTANPTRDVLQAALARIENGVAAFATSSGMAAVELAVSLAPLGSRIVALQDLYGGTYRYLCTLRDEGAYEVDLVAGAEGLARALDCGRAASLVIVESPTNPMMVELDIAQTAALAHAAGALLAVDNTFYTPIVQKPLDRGADLVLHSATKYLGGHNDVLAGAVVVGSDVLAGRLSERLNMTGATLSPFDCWLVLRGLKTLALRMERHEANARAVADALKGSEHVARVLYPGRGGMISFEPAERVNVERVLREVRVFTFAESLGGVESLITCPSVQTHADVPADLRASYGLTDRLLRLSVGVEHREDLIDDILTALTRAARRSGDV